MHAGAAPASAERTKPGMASAEHVMMSCKFPAGKTVLEAQLGVWAAAGDAHAGHKCVALHSAAF